MTAADSHPAVERSPLLHKWPRSSTGLYASMQNPEIVPSILGRKVEKIFNMSEDEINQNVAKMLSSQMSKGLT